MTTWQNQSQNPLIGTWQLVSLESQSSAGGISYPLGEHPYGLLIYSSKRMSGHMMRPDRSAFASGDIRRGTPEEVKAAFEGFVAYCGTYSIDEQRGTVTHHVEASLLPNWVGTGQQRFFTLTGRRLTLRTPPLLVNGQTVTATLVWERVD